MSISRNFDEMEEMTELSNFRCWDLRNMEALVLLLSGQQAIGLGTRQSGRLAKLDYP